MCMMCTGVTSGKPPCSAGFLSPSRASIRSSACGTVRWSRPADSRWRAPGAPAHRAARACRPPRRRPGSTSRTSRDRVRAREQAPGLVHVVGPSGRRVRDLDVDALRGRTRRAWLETASRIPVPSVPLHGASARPGTDRVVRSRRGGGRRYTEEPRRRLIHRLEIPCPRRRGAQYLGDMCAQAWRAATGTTGCSRSRCPGPTRPWRGPGPCSRPRPGRVDASVAHQVIGIVLREFGDIDAAVAELRTARRLAPPRRLGRP